MSEGVKHDIQDLINLEPPKDKKSSRIVHWTIFMFSLFIIAAILAVAFALQASVKREDLLTAELKCVRAAVLVVEQSTADGMNTLLDNDATIMQSLVFVANDNDAGLIESLANVELQIHASEVVQTQIVEALRIREAALRECSIQEELAND